MENKKRFTVKYLWKVFNLKLLKHILFLQLELTRSFEYMHYYVLILTADTRQAGGQADGTMLLANSTPLFPSQAGFWKYTFGFCYLAMISNFLPYLATV